jgi:hypothetical protein
MANNLIYNKEKNKTIILYSIRCEGVVRDWEL